MQSTFHTYDPVAGLRPRLRRSAALGEAPIAISKHINYEEHICVLYL